VADQSLTAGTADAEDLEPWGGLFDGAPAVRAAGLPLTEAEHGGLGGSDTAAAIAEEADDHGGAEFGDGEAPAEPDGLAAAVYANGGVGTGAPEVTH
jgi:hypothetical protein